MSTIEGDSRQDLKHRVSELTWFHQIDLGQGLTTPGTDRSQQKLAALRLPDLTGKSVLDIGANDGFFSFAAERAGASRVLAVDSFCWTGEAPGGQTKATFDLAHEVLGSKVETYEADLDDLTPTEIGVFDVVFMLGVLYHLRDPMLGIQQVASLTRELLILETLVDAVWSPRPAAAFYPSDDVTHGDATNWWGPNQLALVGMIRACGFDDIRLVSDRGILRRLTHTGYNAANVAHSRLSPRRPALKWTYISTDRAIVHARR